MTYTPEIHNWRPSLVPLDQTFRAGGQSQAGGMTLGGALVSNPEPGGRGELSMAFSTFTGEAANLDASWTISQILNGAVMRIPIFSYSVQLLDALSTGAATADITELPWDNDMPWSNDFGWEWDPIASVSGAALKGSTSVSVDLSAQGQVLKIGHVIGFTIDGYDFAHKVMGIIYDAANVATVTISPPLRRDLPATGSMNFRPKMLATCSNAREVAGLFQRGRHMAFNAAKFVEALV